MNYGLLFLGFAIALMAVVGLTFANNKSRAKKELESKLKVSIIPLPLQQLSFDYLYKSNKDASWRAGRVTLALVMTEYYGNSLSEVLLNSLQTRYKEKIRIEMVTDPELVKSVIESEILKRGGTVNG